MNRIESRRLIFFSCTSSIGLISWFMVRSSIMNTHEEWSKYEKVPFFWCTSFIFQCQCKNTTNISRFIRKSKFAIFFLYITRRWQNTKKKRLICSFDSVRFWIKHLFTLELGSSRLLSQTKDVVLSLWDDFLRFPIWFMRKCVVYTVFAWSFNTIYTVLYVVQHVPCRLPYLLIVYVMLLLLVFLFVVVCRSNCDEWLVTLRCYCGAFFINVIWLDRFDISGNAQCSMYCIEPSAVDMGRMVERSMSKK